jgi:hypothetical protein
MDSVAIAVLGNHLYYSTNEEGGLMMLDDLYTFEEKGTNNDRKVVSRVSHFVDLLQTFFENILMFLPEDPSTLMRLICKSWRNKLAGGSDTYWSHVMQQKKWESISSTDNPGRSMCKVFIEHLYLEHCIHAMEQAFGTVQGTDGAFDIAYQFKTTVEKKDHYGACNKLIVWSKNSLLGVYSCNCSLSLFDIHAKKEVAGYYIDEAAHWSIKLCQGAMNEKLVLCQVALGKEYIACWCNTFDEGILC